MSTPSLGGIGYAHQTTSASTLSIASISGFTTQMLFVVTFDTGSTISGVTWNSLPLALEFSNGDMRVYSRRVIPADATASVVISYSAAPTKSIAYAQLVSGLDLRNPIDSYAINSGTHAAGSYTISSGATSAPSRTHEVAIGVMALTGALDSASGSIVNASGYGVAADDVGSGIRLIAYTGQGITGAITYNQSVSASVSVTWKSVALLFKNKSINKGTVYPTGGREVNAVDAGGASISTIGSTTGAGLHDGSDSTYDGIEVDGAVAIDAWAALYAFQSLAAAGIKGEMSYGVSRMRALGETLDGTDSEANATLLFCAGTSSLLDASVGSDIFANTWTNLTALFDVDPTLYATIQAGTKKMGWGITMYTEDVADQILLRVSEIALDIYGVPDEEATQSASAITFAALTPSVTGGATTLTMPATTVVLAAPAPVPSGLLTLTMPLVSGDSMAAPDPSLVVPGTATLTQPAPVLALATAAQLVAREAYFATPLGLAFAAPTPSVAPGVITLQQSATTVRLTALIGGADRSANFAVPPAMRLRIKPRSVSVVQYSRRVSIATASATRRIPSLMESSPGVWSASITGDGDFSSQAAATAVLESIPLLGRDLSFRLRFATLNHFVGMEIQAVTIWLASGIEIDDAFAPGHTGDGNSYALIVDAPTLALDVNVSHETRFLLKPPNITGVNVDINTPNILQGCTLTRQPEGQPWTVAALDDIIATYTQHVPHASDPNARTVTFELFEAWLEVVAVSPPANMQQTVFVPYIMSVKTPECVIAAPQQRAARLLTGTVQNG